MFYILCAGHQVVGSCLVLLSLLSVPVLCQNSGVISFAQELVVVNEGTDLFTPIQIPLTREGGTEGSVVVSITVRSVSSLLCSTH